ncbi:DUF6783 domain-containing protein, partial [Ruminococcus sp. RTP21484sp1_RTP31023st1_H8_RTP31023_210422]|uniref:DUF6783 domain-containing protein n=1 Tax=Ruminococcus sp. RTP21484sp1_RTP31023st1_H8_RTP31023_210422 TaxID=3141611 RepID=UPI0034A193B1
MHTGGFYIIKVYITIICLFGNAVDFSHRNLFSSVLAVLVRGLARACLKKAFCKMCVTICGRFCPDKGA